MTTHHLNPPLELTVTRNTPVHIHVTRQPKSNEEALTQSLARERERQRGYGGGAAAGAAQSDAYVNAVGGSSSRAREYVPEPQQHQQQQQQGERGLGLGPRPATAGAAGSARSQAVHGVRRPFYPPPNRSTKANPGKSLRQGRPHASSDPDSESEALGYEGRHHYPLTTSSESDYVEVTARTRSRSASEYYNDDDQGASDDHDVQDQLAASQARIQRLQEEMAHAADEARLLQESAARSRAQPRGLSNSDRTGRSSNKERSGPAMNPREELLYKLGESENTNKRLREKLAVKDTEIERLSRQVASIDRMQRSFEELKTQMKNTKQRLEAELREKSQELLRRDEELDRALMQQATAANSVNQVQEAVQGMEQAVRLEKESLKQQNKELRHRLRHCEVALEQARTRAADMEKHNVDHDNTVGKLREQVDDLSRAVTDASAQNRMNAKELSTLRAEKEQLIQELNAAHHRISSLEAANEDVVHLQQSNRHLEEAVVEDRGTIQRLEDELREKTAELDQLRDEYEQTSSALNTERDKYRVSSDDQSRMAREISNLQSALADARSQVSQSKNVSANRVAELEVELQRALQVAESLERLQRESEKRHDHQVSELRERLEYTTNAKKSLQSYVDYIKSTYATVFEGA